MNLNQILVILHARWRVIFGVFGGVLFLVIVVSFVWPKQYTAVSSLVVDAKTDPVAGGAGNRVRFGVHHQRTDRRVLLRPNKTYDDHKKKHTAEHPENHPPSGVQYYQDLIKVHF